MSSDRVHWKLSRTGGTVLIGNYKKEFSSVQVNTTTQKIKVVAIDLNKTLILPKSEILHGLDETDWKWWHESVPKKIRAFHANGFVIVISSNQGRLTDWDGNESQEAAPFKRKMECILKELDVPITIFVGCANDLFRKPRPGVWSILPSETGNAGAEIDLDESLIVGDAAGRVNDHSDIDLHWALNLGVKFVTPETFFLGAPALPLTSKFDPAWYLQPLVSPSHVIEEVPAYLRDIKGTTPSIIVLVGLPGAGKTTYYMHYLQPLGYKLISQLTDRDIDNCVNTASARLEQGEIIVIDDLNVSIKSRAVWVSLAQKHQAEIYALYFTASRDLCLHNDSVRALGGPLVKVDDRPIFPRIHFLALADELSRPQVEEGFSLVVDIDFKWLGTDRQLVIWKRYWH